MGMEDTTNLDADDDDSRPRGVVAELDGPKSLVQAQTAPWLRATVADLGKRGF